MIFERNTKFIGEFPLRLYKSDLPSIPTRPHGEMQPIGALWRTLNQEFVEVQMVFIRLIQQDHGIPHSLLDPIHMDIDCTTCKMVRTSNTTNRLIHRLRAISRIDDDGQTRSMGTRLLGSGTKAFAVGSGTSRWWNHPAGP